METVHVVNRCHLVAALLQEYLSDQGTRAELAEPPLDFEMLRSAEAVVINSEHIDRALVDCLQASGATVVLHQQLRGGTQQTDSHRALEVLVESFEEPIVVWLDRSYDPTSLEQWPRYSAYNGRIAGVIQLSKRGPLFEHDLQQMLQRGQSFTEALADPAVMLISRQRLAMLRREMWQSIGVAMQSQHQNA